MRLAAYLPPDPRRQPPQAEIRSDPRDCSRNSRPKRQKRPQLAPRTIKPAPDSEATTWLMGVTIIGGVKMRFLVNALFGKSNSSAREADVFMRRLDRIAKDRTRPFARRAAT